jgi:hypothetical protein
MRIEREFLKKVLFVLPLVLAVTGCTSHVGVTVTHPKPLALSWHTSCSLRMELPASMGSGGYPEPFATVKITNTGKSTQEFSAYKVSFWSGGIVVGSWNGRLVTSYESPGESWTSTSNVSSGSGAWEAVEPPGSPVSGVGVWSAIYEPTGRPMSCTVGSVSESGSATTTTRPLPNTTTPTTTQPPLTTTTAQPQGPIGPASGQVEYVCSDGSGSGGSGGAAIAAVQDGQGNWQCPSSTFFNLWTIEVGGSFYCTVDQDGNAYDSPPYYKATIGNFTVNGVPGTYYGVYCTEPGEDSLFTTP